MVIMENFYSVQDRFYELWREIDNGHLSYLEMEESPEKIEQRNKLEEYIHDFLCVAAHSQKFTFHETEDILQRSASSKKDFSGYKAATGFNAIQLYAANLLSQPWRKEYRQIKTYCGFYKHQIEANLVGAEVMFQEMGYRRYSDGILVLDGPFCPDRVAAVSRDCLIAYMECQIMKAIWEEISSSFKITWLEVLEFRKTHLGGPEQAIKALEYRNHQRQYQEHTRSYSQGSDPFGGPRCQSIPIPSTSPVLPINHSFPPLSGLGSHHHVGLPPPPQNMQPYVYTNGCCPNNYATYGAYAYMPPYGQPMIKPNANGYYYTNGFTTPTVPSGYQYPVPTGALIDLESHNGGYDVVDRPNYKSRHSEHINNDLYKSKNNNENKGVAADKETDKEDSQFEDWAYVYRNLASQGYSKDLGERGDVLSPNSQKQLKEGKKIKETNLDDALNNLLLNEYKPLKINEAIKTLEQEKKKSPEVSKADKTSRASSYENLAPSETAKKSLVKPNKIINYAKTKTLPKEKNNTVTDKLPHSKTLDIRKTKEDKFSKTKETNVNESSKSNPNAWQCKVCTYLNETAKDICDICSKSRSTTVEQPMEIGGAECSKCTLVNPKNLKNCEACGASLKDSPTYI